MDLCAVKAEIDALPGRNWQTTEISPSDGFDYFSVWHSNRFDNYDIPIISVYNDGRVIFDTYLNFDLVPYLPILEIVKRHREGDDA